MYTDACRVRYAYFIVPLTFTRCLVSYGVAPMPVLLLPALILVCVLIYAAALKLYPDWSDE